MEPFNTYFSADQIIFLLCKFRLKYAKQRHKVHLLRDISLHPYTLDNFLKKGHCPEELASLMPARRSWLRLNPKDRKRCRSSTDINFESLRRTILTIHIRVKEEGLLPPTWYVNLVKFIEDIQKRINAEHPSPIKKPTILAIKKENKQNCRKFRPISQYSLEDRIIIGQTARYLTQTFDHHLLDCAYAFRASKRGIGVKTHHDTIDRILDYKRHHLGKNIYVAECDIRKFFDCVRHDHVASIFESFVARAKSDGYHYDDRATAFFHQYLDSYAFNIDIYPLKNTDYFQNLGYDQGEFEWPEEKLKREYYGDGINDYRIGVPQGGALSCLISNLLLHNVDEDVLANNSDKEIEYLRFCDDMILLSINRESCNKALDRYIAATKRNYLLIHEPKEIEKYGKRFYNSDVSKSKMPFLWAALSDTAVSSPWISFVGYQIRYDGSVRVRKKSIEKEVKKQQKEATEVLKAVFSKDIANINLNSRKSLKQQLIALESRLISMSVGRHKIYNYKKALPALCWTNGFKRLFSNSVAKSQLRLLDSKRNRELFRVKKTLANLTKQSENPDRIELPTKYLGAPFSYYAFLHKNLRK
jgi:hypothetical protein